MHVDPGAGGGGWSPGSPVSFYTYSVPLHNTKREELLAHSTDGHTETHGVEWLAPGQQLLCDRAGLWARSNCQFRAPSFPPLHLTAELDTELYHE